MKRGSMRACLGYQHNGAERVNRDAKKSSFSIELFNSDVATTYCGGPAGAKVGRAARSSSSRRATSTARTKECPAEQGIKPSAAPSDPDVGAKPAEAAERQAGLVGVEFPGVEVEHGHRRAGLSGRPGGGRVP